MNYADNTRDSEHNSDDITTIFSEKRARGIVTILL